MPFDFGRIEASRIARGGRDGTAPVLDDSKPYGGRVRETTADGLRFTFKFSDATSSRRNEGRASSGSSRRHPATIHGGGFGHMSPERRREISRKANEKRWAK